MGLTVKRTEKLTQRGRYLDERGLYLQVLSPKNRSWLLRYERGGRERWLGLGPLADFKLEEARERARRARQLLADGLDPLEEKRAKRSKEQSEKRHAEVQAKTFAQVSTEYFNQHQLKWRNAKHRAQFLSTLRQYAFPKFGGMPVSAIDKTAVLMALDPIWHHKTETANRVRQRIEAVLNFATVRGYRTGENPARWKGHLDQVLLGKTHLKQAKHHRALPYFELPSFITSLRERSGSAARALEFLILTGARTGEVMGAHWSEFDLDAKLWVIPAARMKAKREHRVPLSQTAVTTLMKLPREEGNGLVFLGPRMNGLSNMAMESLLRRMGYHDRATVHGFRSTFRDWVSEETNFQPEVAEAALAHVTGDRVERAYKRGDVLAKRRKLMDAWATYCMRRPNSNNVTALKRAS